NSSSVVHTIRVHHETPALTPAPPIYLMLQCAADVPPPVDLTAQDNCDGPITVSPTEETIPGDCANQFVLIRTWTFTDVCDNTSRSVERRVGQDETPPWPPAPPGRLTL